MSPLPEPDTSWPPAGNARRYDRMRTASAWYAGTRDALLGVSTSTGPQQMGGPHTVTTINPTPGLGARLVGAFRNEFWGPTAVADGEADTRRHLPLAQDVAKLSSEWLYSEPIKIIVDGPLRPDNGAPTADRDANGDPVLAWRKGDPMPETQAAQRRLERRLRACNFDAMLLAAGEIGSALGSYGFRIVFDKAATPDGPIIARADADTIIPVYRWGQLVGVAFWAVVRADAGDEIWRHVELHENGGIWHGLYKGSSDNVGKRQSLTALNVTAPLAQITDSSGQVLNALGAPLYLAGGGKTAVSIPNMLPDPTDRQAQAGRSDYTDPVLDLFDAADRIYTQFMDSIEEGRGLTFLSEAMLTTGRPGEGVSVNRNQRTFTKLKLPPAERESGQLPIEKVQFEMHVEELLRALYAVIALAIQAAGYNPDGDTAEDGRDVTATEYRGKAKKSLTTRDKKIRYAEPELAALLTSFLRVDVDEYAPRETVDGVEIPVQAYPVRVQFPDAVQPSMLELANVAKAMKESGGADVLDLVRTLHPDWSQTEQQAQADRLLRSASVIDPVSFGSGGSGVGAGDGV